MVLSGCGGGGGGDNNPPAATNVTVSGAVTYQKVPFRAVGMGLDYNATFNAPVRGAVVEAIDSGNGTTILATTTTDASGNYSMQVPSSRSVFVRVKAQMLRTGTPSWNFRVLNNTNGNALYVLDGTAFTTGVVPVSANLNAASGWTGASYGATRAAAPFSLLDVAYEVMTLVQTADANAVFAPLNIFWSPQNRALSPFDPTTGAIVTTSYLSGATGGVFVLGDANTDTDEYDQHVIAHELGHYFQDVFSRDDSLGGDHSSGNLLDLRVAFSEGWGNAFSGMVKGDPRYRDSFGPAQNASFEIDVEFNPVTNRGWYNEASVQSLIYDFFDTAADGVDAVALGFAPIFQVMSADFPTLEPHTAIFPFVALLKSRNPGSATAIDTLVSAQNMQSATIDELGSTETNAGGAAANLPVYVPITVGGPAVQVCSSTANGDYNKLGNRKFLRFNVPFDRQITMRANVVGVTGRDPDLVLHRQGLIDAAESNLADTEQLTRQLAPGNYVLEVYDFFAVDFPAPSDPPTDGNTCMDVTVFSTL